MNAHTTQDIPFIPAPRITTVIGYLLTRLAEAGLISVFGLPGDYNLGILDAIAARADLAWIGMATDQGAGYAADSYARQRGLGALVTTFGVGELSAMNAIAGAYAESVPVVHIVGTPALGARESAATLHHNLPGHDYGHFARMAAEVTVAQADLRAATAPEEIDRVLSTALRTSRPVYLTIPADVADLPVLAPAGRVPRAGAVQQTAAELGTLLGQGLAPVIIVLNNGGCMVERTLMSPVALRAITSHELAWALNAASTYAGAGRPVLIEAALEPDHAPPMLQDLTGALAPSQTG